MIVIGSVFSNGVAFLAMFLFGTNFAFIVQAERLFPSKTCRFWRVFFIGKSVLTGLIAYDLYLYNGPITWMIYLLTVGICISLTALWLIWHDRPFVGIPKEEVVTTNEGTVIVKGQPKAREENETR